MIAKKLGKGQGKGRCLATCLCSPFIVAGLLGPELFLRVPDVVHQLLEILRHVVNLSRGVQQGGGGCVVSQVRQVS